MEKSREGMFRSLLHQVLRQNTNLLSDFVLKYKQKDALHPPGWQWHVQELSDYLKQILLRQHKQRIFIFVDALDECESRDLRLTADFLNKTASSATNCGYDVRLCLSSRRFPNITMGKHVEIHMEDNNEADISHFVSNTLREMGQDDDELETRIVQRSAHVFLWAVLVLLNVREAFEDGERQDRLIEVVESTPEDLTSLFQQSISLISTNERDDAFHMFIWVIFAGRPLTPTEYRYAIAFRNPFNGKEACEESPSFIKSDDQLAKLLRKRSRGLIELVATRNSQPCFVQPFHASVKEFLLADGLQMISPPLTRNIALEGHIRLKEACLNYLKMESLPAGDARSRHYEIWDARRKLASEYASLPFLSYAIDFLFEHAAEIERAPNFDSKFWEELVQNNDRVSKRWGNYFCLVEMGRHKLEHKPTILYATSLYGLSSSTKALLQLGHDPNIKGGHLGFPLQAAASRGHANVVEVLVLNGARIDDQGGFYGNALQAAAYEGHRTVAELLLKNGAALDGKGGYYGTPFHAAACKGFRDIVQLFLDNGASIDISGTYWSNSTQQTMKGNVIFAALTEGHKELAEMLLQKSDNIKQRDKRIIMIAASRDYEKILDMCLNQSEDVGTLGSEVNSALPMACSAGHEGIVRKLLDYTSNIDSHGTYADRLSYSLSRGSALEAAVSQGHERIANILISKGATINKLSGDYKHALLAAISGGSNRLVDKLLQEGADPKAKGWFWNHVAHRMEMGTALYAASFYKDPNMVQSLLLAGADANELHGSGRYALLAAVSSGREDTVRALLAHGADVHLRGLYWDSRYQRMVKGDAMTAAFSEGHWQIVDLLSTKGVPLTSPTLREKSSSHVQSREQTELSDVSTSFHSKRIRVTEPIPGVIGLANRQKVGWMNAALQFLRSAKSLTEYFLGKPDRRTKFLT